MKAPSITINKPLRTKESKANLVTQTTFSVDQIKTIRDSSSMHIQSSSGISLPNPIVHKSIDSFLQDKDLALQPLDFLDYHSMIQSQTVSKESDHDEHDSDYDEDNLSAGFNSVQEG